MNNDEIIEVGKKQIPLDYKERKNAILSNAFEDTEVVVLGSNRGQLLMRLPTRMTNRMKLKKGVKVRIIQKRDGEQLIFTIKVAGNEKKTR